MKDIDRRTFLAGLAGSLLAPSAFASRGLLMPDAGPQYGTTPAVSPATGTCWLDIAAPFLVHEPRIGLSTELLLTATCFPGQEGFRDSQNATEYELELFDANGEPTKLGGGQRQVISAMRPTVLRLSDYVGDKPFWGSARLRLAPRGKQVTHAGDLFSAGFVRWNLPGNFDNVHAHPAPPKQARGRFFYSMPFPSLDEYHCAFALFNPNDDTSAGTVRLVNRLGEMVIERPYKLGPRQSTLYSLADLKTATSPEAALAPVALTEKKLSQGGVVVVTNQTEAVAFAYTFMKGRSGQVFSVEHPLHFQDAPVVAARKSPYGPKGNFPAEALLYTPMLFSSRRFGDLQLESRLYLSASRWREEALWMMPFVTNGEGRIAWVSNQDEKFPERVQPAAVTDQGVVRLAPFQSCMLNARSLPLEDSFSGGFGVATIPATSHSLLKVEVRALPWGRVAFTHFRPGGQAHKRYRQVAERGGLATDYIISGFQVRGSAQNRKFDSLLAVMNIEFAEDTVGTPKIELFGPAGFLAEKSLGSFPPLACRHFLLSELFPDLQTEPGHPLTVRMVEANAMMVASALHIDYEKRDIAMDHGSDRHSTYLDYGC